MNQITKFLTGSPDERWEAAQALCEQAPLAAKAILSPLNQHAVPAGNRRDDALSREANWAERDRAEGEAHAARTEDYTLDEEGRVRWNSNGSVPPSDVHFWMQVALRDDLDEVERIMEAGKRETARVLAEYREQAAKAGPDPAVQAQADASGETLVNVLTGQTYTPRA